MVIFIAFIKKKQNELAHGDKSSAVLTAFDLLISGNASSDMLLYLEKSLHMWIMFFKISGH